LPSAVQVNYRLMRDTQRTVDQVAILLPFCLEDRTFLLVLETISTMKPEIMVTTLENSPPAQKGRRRSILLPQAYDERAMPALRLTRSSQKARYLARFFCVLMGIGFILLLVAPWQQSVRGNGNVVAYTPNDRMQTIEAPIKGRIARWGENIFENAHVTKGQFIAEVKDLDESYFERLQSQMTATQSQLQSLRLLSAANTRNLEACLTVVTTLNSQVNTYQMVKEQILAAADAGIEASKSKVVAEQQKLAEVEATLAQVQADFVRQKTLFNENITSELKYQESERKQKETQAKLAQIKAYLLGAEADLAEKLADRNAKAQKAQVDIEYATAMVRKAHGDVAKAESEVEKANSELNKAEKELIEIESKVARQATQQLYAPFDGFITSITPNQGSQVLKEGDPVCVIIPDTSDRAVQVWLSGNDAPLVEAGRHVRLQFEGWPAIQFAGWPSVAVGTFGGTIISVDAVDDGKGKFRALVLPDESSHAWPADRYLRQGVRANAWVLLNRVPLWYEFWRQLNGFPPVLDHPEDAFKNEKKPKLPKA
jgi:multidrug resistance efflux pump